MQAMRISLVQVRSIPSEYVTTGYTRVFVAKLTLSPAGAWFL